MLNVQANMVFLGTENKDFKFTDKTSNSIIEGTSHKIKFMDMSDNAIYIFKMKEDNAEYNKLTMFKNYLVHLNIIPTVKENIVSFDKIEKEVFK
jgi:hypothetical protein